jgi:peroxiredoxin Q/BCP
MKIKTGDRFPEFTLPDHDNKPYSFPQDQKGSPLVLYFYPKDETPGCTKEACSFRDSHEQFMDEGVTVIGVSNDSPEKHRRFRKAHRLPFRLLSDRGNKLRKTVGVPSDLLGLLPGRVTYIIDGDGLVKKIINSQMNTERHIRESLQVIKSFKVTD